MKSTIESHRAQRGTFMAEITEIVSKDERFVAGWLTGSLSNDEADWLSDIDISLAIADQHAATLCERFHQVSADIAPDRYTFFSQFGLPALIHENNNNAPEGGTFTFILYAESALMVDWILVPLSRATRPHQSKLLFDRVGVPVTPPAQPEVLDQRKIFVAEKWAFCWMMMAITIKYIIRGDGVFAAQWIENLHGLIYAMERQVDGKSREYHRGSFSQLQSTADKQVESLMQICQRMQKLQPKVSEFTGTEILMPLAEIKILISLADI